MYNRKTKQVILEIPKNGSRSLVQAAITAHGKKPFTHHGHKTLQEVTDLITLHEGSLPEGLTAVAVYRHPAGRLVSQIRQYMVMKKASYKAAVDAAIEGHHVVFRPQYIFRRNVNDVEVKEFTMARQADAQAWVSGLQRLGKKALRLNTSGAEVPQLRVSDELYKLAEELYPEDFAVYRDVRTRETEEYM